MNERLYYIDWLRVLAMGAVFFFHCARFFGGGIWHLNNAEVSIFAHLFIGILDLWLMPLFFLLSGVGAWYGLQRKTGNQFIWERIKRLLIPLYTVGLFFLIPPQFYFELCSNAGFTGTFWDVLPRYFERFFSFNPAWPGSFVPYTWSGHLWFLQFLFLISLATLPALAYLKTPGGTKIISLLAGWFGQRGGAFLFVIPMCLIMIPIRHFFHVRYTWAEFLVYALLFVLGYIIPADKRFVQSFDRSKWLGLALGLIGFGGEGFLILGLHYQFPGGEPFSMLYIAFNIIFSFASWGWIVFILGTGSKQLNFNHYILSYANKAVLPFYIFHQTVILVVGWFIIPLELSMIIKYILIAIVSFISIMILYQGLVKQFRPIQLLFGMKMGH
jgi:hypothetical protein